MSRARPEKLSIVNQLIHRYRYKNQAWVGVEPLGFPLFDICVVKTTLQATILHC